MHIPGTQHIFVCCAPVDSCSGLLYRLAYFKGKSTDKHAHEKIEKKYLFYFLNLVFLGILVMHGYLYDHIIGNP